MKKIGQYSGLQSGLEGITVNGNELTMCYETGIKNTTRISMNELIEKCSSGKYNPSLTTKAARISGGIIYKVQELINK